MKPSIATILTLAFAACFVMWVMGCSARTSSEAPGAALPTLTPKPHPAIENSVQQAGGVNTQATGVNYSSDFGAGATACVALTLILNLILSHRREMKRIAMNGKH